LDFSKLRVKFRALFFSVIFVLCHAVGALASDVVGSDEPATQVVDSSERSPAARARVIKKILIRGNKKIEAAAIAPKILSKVGQPYNSDLIRQDIEELYKSGFFYDIAVDRRRVRGGWQLTYLVKEKPSVTEIEFLGNNEVEDDELLETSGLKPYEIYSVVKVQNAIEKLEKLYEDKGYFLASIRHKVTPIVKGETVRLTIEVVENDMVQVKQIHFIGNRKLSSTKLKSLLATQEGGFFSFISGSGSYKQDAFDRDVQVINYLYFNEGFVQVKVDRPQVYVTPDKKGIYITIRIQEGEQFNIGSIDFAGDLLFSDAELRETIGIEEGELYSYEKIQRDLSALTAKYGDLGYAYANVIPRTRIREKERLVDMTFEFDKGNKVYIGEINVKGNDRTRDKVVRRELRIYEGELYNETRKRESLANVKRLGFFEEVNFNRITPNNNKDIMNIDIVVKERNTGTVQVGAGYSSFQGFVLNGQVNEINLLGRGQKLGASLDYSERQQLFNINFTEPYFMDTEWSVGFDAYQRKRRLLDYSEEKIGGAVRIGHPLAPYLRGFISYKVDDTEIDTGDDGDPDLFPVETVNGLTSSVTTSLVYDKRNDRFAPTDGMYSSVSLEYAGVGGDLNYTKGLATLRYYKKVFWEFVWRNNINYGFVSSNDASEPPFNELFLLGGANTLRGYDWFTVGRRKFSEKTYNEAIAAGETDEEATNSALRPFGGTQQLYYQMEMQFPLIEEAGIQGVVFYDVGNADDKLKLEDFRSDVGFGFRWYSPIGPLRFEWGFPFAPRDEFDEKDVNFQFAIGSPF
jgi:outer membrane protein insertion porin family